MTQEQAIEQYQEYLEGHIGNVIKALDILYTLDIPFITEHIDELREIVKEHDASKYEEPEWSAYLHHFYPTNDEESKMEEEFDSAVKHHIKNNKHHWNYWCDDDNNLINNIDENEYKLYTIERICDWLAMAAQHNEGPTEYYDINKDFVVQPDYARELCDSIFYKIPEDFSKDMWKITRGELDEDFLPMNKEYVNSLGKRVKKSKTSNTIEIDTQMTNHDAQLEAIDSAKFDIPRENIYVHTDNDNHQEGYIPVLGYGYYLYHVDHVCNTYHKDISEGKNHYYKLISNKIAKTKNIDSSIEGIPDELWKKLSDESHLSLDSIKNMGSEKLLSTLAYRLKKKVPEIMMSGGIDGILMEDASDMYGGEDTRELIIYNMKAIKKIRPLKEMEVEYPKKPKDIIKYEYYNDNGEYVIDLKDGWEDPVGNNYIIEKTKRDAYRILRQCTKIINKKLDESILNEMKLSQIKQKSKNQDPRRIAKSKNVKSTYIGMSKFGILNFKTTSETRNGYHYQTIEFKDMKPFEDIIKSGKSVTPQDIKNQFKEQDVNIWCTDESFAFWAWAHQAYKMDFLYIDDRIPNLKKAIQAPKVNNVRLNGGACKHILSVIDYVTKPFVLLAISDDMNKYLEGNQEDKFAKQSVAVQNQYDMVADWDWSDIEETIGKSRIEIMSDISKTLQIIPSTDKGDIITDIVGEILPQESQGLKREIVDRIEELIDKEEK